MKDRAHKSAHARGAHTDTDTHTIRPLYVVTVHVDVYK